MELESQSVINPHNCYGNYAQLSKISPIKTWIKFITPLSSFGPSLECLVLESSQISWISPLSASLIFLDLALIIGPTRTCNGPFNGACWFSSNPSSNLSCPSEKSLGQYVFVKTQICLDKSVSLHTHPNFFKYGHVYIYNILKFKHITRIYIYIYIIDGGDFHPSNMNSIETFFL